MAERKQHPHPSAGTDGSREGAAAEAAAPEAPPVRAADEEIEPVGEEASDERQVEHDLDELLAKARERDEYLALAQRTQADFENYRKRMTREASVAEARGTAKLAKELLPALDHLDLALENVGNGGEDVAKGIQLVQADLVAALKRLGIEAYSPAGERFDPAEHEAMASQPVEGAESGTVVEVYQPGYRLNDTILRPARVVVAQ
jgi:molecular chaperone GrpE